MTSVVLAFPPLSEASQLPYAALGHLASEWAAGGLRVRTCDANLAYMEWAVLAAPAPPASGTATPTARAYTEVAAQARSAQGPSMLNVARGQTAADGTAAALAVQRFTTRRATADGWVSEIQSLREIDDAVAMAADSPSTLWLRDHLLNNLERAGARVLALTVPFFSQLVPALAAASALRAVSPSVRVVAGGPTVQMWARRLDEQVTAASAVDAWCVGHGEGYQDEVVRGERRYFGSLQGLDLRRQTIPAVDRERLPHYLNGDRQLAYRTTVGCYWGRCTFCSYGNRYLAERAFGQVDVDRAAGHLAALFDSHGVDDFSLADENTSLRLLHRLSRATARRRPGLKLRTRARLEPLLLKRRFVDELVSAGVVQLSVGLETTSQDALDNFDKGLQADTFDAVLTTCAEAGLAVNVSLVDGFSGAEAAHTGTKALLERHIDHVGIDTLQLIAVEPGSLLEADLGTRVEEELVNSGGLSFAGGRHGGPLVAAGARAAAAHRLRSLSGEVVPASEEKRRKDVVRTEQTLSAPRAVLRDDTVALGEVGGRRYLADLAWPALVELHPAVVVGRRATGEVVLEAGSAEAWSWLRRCAARSFVLADRKSRVEE